MLVLWSPEYFTRLWCCFELAVFLEKSSNAERESLLQNSYAQMRRASDGAMLDLPRNSSPTEIDNEETVPAGTAEATGAHKTRDETHDRKLVIIPVQMGVLCVCILLSTYLVGVACIFLEFVDRDLVQPFRALLAFLGLLCLCRFTRRYAQERLELNKQIAQFTVSQAECFASEDREFIKAVITGLYSKTLNEIEGIAAFESVVRSRVQQNVNKFLGSRLLVPWRLTLACMFVVTLRGLDTLAEETFFVPSLSADSETTAERVAKQAATSFSHICVVPAFLYCAIVTACLLPRRQRKVAEFASYVIFVLVNLIFLYVCQVLVSEGIRDKMPTLVSVPLNLIFGLILLSAPACCNYAWTRREPNQETGDHESQTTTQTTTQTTNTNTTPTTMPTTTTITTTHWDEDDCEKAPEPEESQGPTSMNVMAPLPAADEPLVTITI
ncbi:unnamed protein product [Polarella glacialis]|uniref:Uncharacterized protein n=2 Tax=Polarella glacialis TaxID=89957 RepID=A0A813M8V3_POLGL|nr:unnamed protein product [Polarella glacialis]